MIRSSLRPGFVASLFFLAAAFPVGITHAVDPGCTNGDCLPDPGCTNGDCSPPDPGCTNGDCPPDPGCTNGDCPSDPGCTDGDCPVGQDADGDHYTAHHDCDDQDPTVHPFAPEICDGQDNNCNGFLGVGEEDRDGDGYLGCDSDCNDEDPGVNPGSHEIPGNDIDEDCDGSRACDPSMSWKNHGHYVSCVVHELSMLVRDGILTEKEGSALVSAAARSRVGKK